MAAAKKENRCWPGYEPVKGKEPHSEGSCRPKPAIRSNKQEKEFKAKRDQQLDRWQEKHPGSPRKSAQHLHAPGSKKTATKKATKKTTARSKSGTIAEKRSAKKRSPSKRRAAR
jgi:hypothetical protein